MESKQPEQGNPPAGSSAPRPQPHPPQPKPQGTVNLLTNFLAACARNIAATATGALGPVSSPASSPGGDGARPPPSTLLPPGEGTRVTAHPSPAADPHRNSSLGTQPNGATRTPGSVVHDDTSRPPAARTAGGSSTGHHPSGMTAAGLREEAGYCNNSSGNDELEEVVAATVPGEDDGAGGQGGSNNGRTPIFADDPFQVREKRRKKKKMTRFLVVLVLHLIPFHEVCCTIGGHIKWDQIILVKIHKYIGFSMYRRSYLLWPPVILCAGM